MARSIKLFLILSLIWACSKEEQKAAEPIHPLIGLWQYERLIVADSLTTIFASNKMEPGTFKGQLGGERAEINRRRVRYYEDGTYQLIWLDRGSYDLGSDGDPNWQPAFGMFRTTLGTDSLFHNQALYYSQAYQLEFQVDTLIRTSFRYMSSNSSDNNGSKYENLWKRGDIVKFVEVFSKVP